MILNGFTIENWTCLKRVHIPHIPPAGISIFSGPNGTGKSSIVQALRAALFDYPVKSTKIKDYIPIHSQTDALPKIEIFFTRAGTQYRLTKQYHKTKGKAELASRLDDTRWRVEVDGANEVDETLARLLHAETSTSGMYQLLWMDQASYSFDWKSDKQAEKTQSQLRQILGVLQTNQDDRFLARLQEKWDKIFQAKVKTKDLPKNSEPDKRYKPSSDVLQAIHDTREKEESFRKLNEKHKQLQAKLNNLEDAQQTVRNFRRQLETARQNYEEAERAWQDWLPRQQHFDQLSRTRDELQTARKKLLTDHADWQQRQQKCEELTGQIHILQEKEAAQNTRGEPLTRQIDDLRQQIVTLRQREQTIRQMWDDIQEQEHRKHRESEIQRQQQLQRELQQQKQELDEAQKDLSRLIAPAKGDIEAILHNRQQLKTLEQEWQTEAWHLHIQPANPTAIEISRDGQPVHKVHHPETFQIGEQARLTLADGSRIEFHRPKTSDARTAEEYARLKGNCEREYQTLLARFELTTHEPDPVARLYEMQSRETILKEDLQKRKKAWQKWTKELGEDPLAEVEKKIRQLKQQNQSRSPANSSDAPERTQISPPPSFEEIEQLKNSLPEEIQLKEKLLKKIEEQRAEAESQLQLLRTELTEKTSRRNTFQEILAKDATESDWQARLQASEEALATVEKDWDASREEARAGELLQESKAIAKRSWENMNDLFRNAEGQVKLLTGEMIAHEGLHQELSEAEAAWNTARQRSERLIEEAESLDYLSRLFEDCREKQYSTVLQPIHKRLSDWQTILKYPYQRELLLNDQFLAEKLSGADGDLNLDQESEGTQEQFFLLVRLALGTLLSQTHQPQCAVLDDPLTHTDSHRLIRMHHILRQAAQGQANSQPPFHPLHILLFSCHPDRFVGLLDNHFELAKNNLCERFV